MRRYTLVLLALLVAPACSSSTTPTPSIQGTNHAPVIATVSVTPASGVAQVTPIAFSVTATDADADPLSFAWVVTGGLVPRAGSSFVSSAAQSTQTLSFVGSGTLQVTVTDGRGGSVTASQPLVLGTVTGNWTEASGSPFCGIPAFGVGTGLSMSLLQTGSSITETTQIFSNQGTGIVGDILTSNPGTVSATGHIKFEVVASAFEGTILDAITFEGDFDATFQHITYTVTDIGPKFLIGVPAPCTMTFNKE